MQFNTPMMQQYQQIKEQHQDCLLFFRLGDFYELFNDDAKLGAQLLNITLTKRPRGKDGDIPMAGVPFHAADSYIAKLVRAGYKIAICEQVSEPNSKGIVDREVIRIVTPGTILDEKNLDKCEHNYIMSLSATAEKIGIAVADLSTGDFQSTEIFTALPGQDLSSLLGNELARFCPAECIVNQETYQNHELLKILSQQKTMNIYPFANWDDLAEEAEEILKKHFQIKTLQSFDLEEKPEAQRSAAALLGYLKHTQKDQVGHLKSIRSYIPQDYVLLDHSTIVNLELFSTIRDQQEHGSLIQVLDHTATAMGARLLRSWLRKPLSDKTTIQNRLDAVQELVEDQMLKDNLRELLRQIYDLPRLISRLSVGIGNAYDLVNLKLSLQQTLKIKTLLLDRRSLSEGGLTNCRSLNKEGQNIPSSLQDIINLVETTIIDNPPIDTKNGGLVKSGINEELDTLRAEVGGGRNWIVKLEMAEKKRTGINSLKIKFNQVFGYFIEISKANLHLVPKNYIRKQTMVNAERFITPQLKEYEEKVLRGQETINNLEHQIFLEVVEKVLSQTEQLQQTAESLANIDCLANFADIAIKNHYIKPILVESGDLLIKEGRHPVVENLPRAQFVPNDTQLNLTDHQLLILTGPNMAGKSVYMRQVALITLMAHLGSFVPAQSATISLVDRIFCRSGASDIIASGLSTFMVEMVETAHILNQATNKSLVIMDEIGRGTSTYDGISIAWAVAEHLVTNPQVQAKTLFATHYHELQMLEDQYPDRIKNYNVAVQEKSDGQPIFLHKLIPGRASHSYAIAVAKLAGVPKIVTEQAQKILKKLEITNLNNGNSNPQEKTQKTTPGLNNFSSEEITSLDLQNLTPLEALNKLSELQKKIIGHN